MAKGVKVKAVPDWMRLDGKFFHTVDPEGYVDRQGQIIAERGDGTVIVRLFEWVTGSETGIQLMNTFHFEKAWLYETDAEMREAYEHHRKVRPHKGAVPVAAGGA